MTTLPPDDPQPGVTPPGDVPPGVTPTTPSAAPGGSYPPPPTAPAGAAPTAYGVGVPLSDSDQRLWATIAHIGGVFVSFLVPLVIWLVYKGRGPFVEDQAKEALNFQITLAIAYLVGVLTIVFVIGIFILIAAAICALVFAIMAAIQVNQGVAYRYPFTIRLVK